MANIIELRPRSAPSPLTINSSATRRLALDCGAIHQVHEHIRSRFLAMPVYITNAALGALGPSGAMRHRGQTTTGNLQDALCLLQLAHARTPMALRIPLRFMVQSGPNDYRPLRFIAVITHEPEAVVTVLLESEGGQ